MDKDDSILKFKNNDFDFLLKQRVVEWFDLVINKSVSGDLGGFFEGLKKLHSLISYYEFSNKEMLKGLSEVLAEHFDRLKGQPPSRRDAVIIRNQEKRDLYSLLDLFFTEVVKAYADLGLWFNTKVESNDFELLLSDQNFNDSFSSVKDKKEFLKAIDSDVLVSLMSPNMVTEIHTKYLVESALKGD